MIWLYYYWLLNSLFCKGISSSFWGLYMSAGVAKIGWLSFRTGGSGGNGWMHLSLLTHQDWLRGCCCHRCWRCGLNSKKGGFLRLPCVEFLRDSCSYTIVLFIRIYSFLYLLTYFTPPMLIQPVKNTSWHALIQIFTTMASGKYKSLKWEKSSLLTSIKEPTAAIASFL